MISLAVGFVLVGTLAHGRLRKLSMLTGPALLLAGCTSSAAAISGVYLFGITYVEDGRVVVRSGYFGLCVK